MQLHHVAEGLPRREDQIHAVMPLGAAVTDIGRVEPARTAALFIDTPAHLRRNLVQVHASWMAVAVDIPYQDLRLADVFLIPSRSKLERVKLCP